MSNTLDQIRDTVMKRVDRANRLFQLGIWGGVLLEGVFIAAIILMVDFQERTQALITLSAFAVYTFVILGLVMLGIHITRSTCQILLAIEALQHRESK